MSSIITSLCSIIPFFYIPFRRFNPTSPEILRDGENPAIIGFSEKLFLTKFN